MATVAVSLECHIAGGSFPAGVVEAGSPGSNRAFLKSRMRKGNIPRPRDVTVEHMRDVGALGLVNQPTYGVLATP